MSSLTAIRGGGAVPDQPLISTLKIQRAGGIKTMMFGGEGLLVATLRGPGSVWFQSLPLSRLAGRIAGTFARGKGEGSLLGNVANVFESR